MARWGSSHERAGARAAAAAGSEAEQLASRIDELVRCEKQEARSFDSALLRYMSEGMTTSTIANSAPRKQE